MLLTIPLLCFFVTFSGISYCETVELKLSRGCWRLTEFSDLPCAIPKVGTTQMGHIQMDSRRHLILFLSVVTVKLNIHLECVGKNLICNITLFAPWKQCYFEIAIR